MEGGEGIAALLPETSSLEWFDCTWKCTTSQGGAHPEKWHRQKPTYPEGGNTDREDGAPKRWRDTDELVPWLHPSKDDGVNSHHAGTDYHIARGSPAASYPYPTYATEGHHCISCEIFSSANYPALVHNALLMGYNINCKENGFHVPAYVVDIVCHDLQNHASSHTWSEPAPLEYNLDEKLEPYLRNLEEKCMRYCRMDGMGTAEAQQRVLDDLHQLSEMVRRKIAGWQWFLTKLARMRLKDIRSYGTPVPKPQFKSKVLLPDSKGVILMKYKDAALSRSNLMPKGFPDWDYYIAAALEALDEGAAELEPFSRWLSRRMLQDKMQRANMFAVDQPGVP